jgi:hypothetical protein
MTVTVSNNELWIIKMSIIRGPIKQYLNQVISLLLCITLKWDFAECV